MLVASTIPIKFRVSFCDLVHACCNLVGTMELIKLVLDPDPIFPKAKGTHDMLL